MKKIIVCVLVMLLTAACTNASQPPKEEKGRPALIAGADLDEMGGADAYAGSGDHANSPYYANPDFYRMTSNDHLTILPQYKTMQQTTEWSCGNVAVLMALTHLGITDYTEEMLAVGMLASTDLDTEDAAIGTANNYHEYGTDVKRMYDYLRLQPAIRIVETSYRPPLIPIVSSGYRPYLEEDLLSAEDGVSGNDIGNLPGMFTYASLYTSDNDDASENYVEDAKDSYFVKWLLSHLQENRSILVEWGDWDGHWVNIIGYDSLGTPSIGDDMLIFADPYDTGDHWQDGYAYFPLEKFFSMWKDRNVAPKPYQLQPYMIIDKASK